MAKKSKSGLEERYTRASADRSYRTIATLDGEVGTGKTYFGFTGPEPILSQNIDLGTEGVVEQFVEEGKEIYEEKYVWSPGDAEENDRLSDDEEDLSAYKQLQEAAIEVRNQFEKDFYYALKNGIRTIIHDTSSRIWQCFRYAEFGSPKGDNPRDFDALNARFEKMITEAKATPNVNLFLVQSLKDKWGMNGPVNKKTGKKGFGKSGTEVWGYEHLPKMVSLELTFKYLQEDDPLREEVGTDDGYIISFGKCRYNKDLQFTHTPRCTFPQLGEMLIEGSSAEDWL